MIKLHPYLHFTNNCREAMTFYQQCLGGELAFQTIGESPMAAEMPAVIHQNILHSTLTKDGEVLLYGSDMMQDKEVRHGNTIILCLNCGSRADIDTIFAKLSEGGFVLRPLKEESFGLSGQVVDKYGLRWMLRFDPNVSKT